MTKGSSLPPIDELVQQLRKDGLPVPASVPNSDLITKFIPDDEFYLQQKLDGHRVALAFTSKIVVGLNRNGNDYSGTFKNHTGLMLEATYLQLKSRNISAIIDCEYLVKADQLWAFDVPYLAIGDQPVCTPQSPFEKRLRALELIGQLNTIGVTPVATSVREKTQLASSLIDHKAEGIVVRSKNFGWNDPFFKVKFVKDAECFVIGPRGEKDSVAVGVLRGGQEVEVGACSTLGKEPMTPGDIVTVRYLYLGSDNRLVQPRIMHLRSDKVKGDCQWDQLVPTNKDVYQP